MLRTTDGYRASGAVSQAAFFGRGQTRMFGVLHLPRRRAHAGVLICSPIQSEFLVNYRRELWLAQALANAGVAVCRFHYRGTGHSDEAELTFDSMRGDAHEAIEWMREHAEVGQIGLLGTRWGGIVAAAVASDIGASPLALWSPALQGDAYLREIFRLRRMAHLSRGESGSESDPFDEASRRGYADIFGFAIEGSFVESIRARRLTREVGNESRPILIAQIDPRTRLTPDFVEIVEAWRTAGFAVDVHLEKGQEAWWFPGAQWRDDAIVRGRSLVTQTMSWFSSQLKGTSVG